MSNLLLIRYLNVLLNANDAIFRIFYRFLEYSTGIENECHKIQKEAKDEKICIISFINDIMVD